jgi:DNA modification methylase
MEYLIQTYTDKGDVVVDPFMGTGATAVACKNTNRSFIGGDMNAEYVAIADRRIKAP